MAGQSRVIESPGSTMSTHSRDPAPFGRYAPAGFVERGIRATRALGDGWVPRRLMMVIRRVVTRLLRGAPVDIEALGIRMRLHPQGNICEKRLLYTPGSFDREELRRLAAILRDDFVFIDVGANVGAYSLFVASRTGPTARVLAIEPQPAIFERLVFNIRQNAFATIKAVECAASDRAGELTLFLDPRNSGESSVRVVNHGGSQPIRIPARTLLELIGEEGFDHVDAIKLDVEGAEDLVLEPYLRNAPAHLLARLVIVEDGSRQWHSDLLSLLTQTGYRQVARTRLNLIFDREEGA